MVLLLLLRLLFLSLIEWGFMMRTPKRISLRTFVIGRFIRNARSFYLISQTLLFPICIALGVGNLSMRNPWGVPVCSYRSSTPTCMPSIPLSLHLLQYSWCGEILLISPQSSLLRVQGSLIWWWPSFSYHGHNITLSLSLVLVSLFLFRKIFLYIFLHIW